MKVGINVINEHYWKTKFIAVPLDPRTVPSAKGARPRRP